MMCSNFYRGRTLRIAVGITLVIILLIVNSAGAATLVVDSNAVKSNNDKKMGAFSTIIVYPSLQDAINASNDGDTIDVRAGTYPGNQILINKSLIIQGAGSAITIIDGGNATLTTQPGLIFINATSGNVTFSGFTIRNAGANPGITGTSGIPVRVGIYASSSNASATFTISNNRIIGSNNDSDEEDFGFYSNFGLENLEFTNNEITVTGSNAILLEKHYGATNVSYNTWDRGVANGSVDPYFNMNYGGSDITSLQKVSNNSIYMNTGMVFDNNNLGFAISFAASFTGATGGFTNVQVTNNTITDLKAYRRGISLWNNGDGITGNINAPVVSGNTIKGAPGSNVQSIGIQLLGLIIDASITNNSIDNVDISFTGQALISQIATGTILNYNNFTNSITGLYWQGPSILDATYNWWGSDSGPGPVGPGSGDHVSTNVLYDPWLPDTPPASVTNLMNVSHAANYINWTWTDPANIDFEKVLIYLDGDLKDPVLKGVQHYNATVFPGTHTIGTRTVDVRGNENATIVLNTSTTILPEIRFINGTVYLNGTSNGIPDVKVSISTLFTTNTNETGFYSLAVGSDIYDLTAKLDPTYYPNSTIQVSTIGEAVVLKDISLDKKPVGKITGSVTTG